MPLFRKRPAVIEARQFTELEAAYPGPDGKPPAPIELWSGGSIKGVLLPPRERVIHIQTPEGEMEGRIGDWIIKGVNVGDERRAL